MFNDNATPYGFNGVFTKSENGGSMLYNRIPLYSPTGIYPGSAKVTDEVLDTLLKCGSNIQIVSQMLGLWAGENNPQNTDLGNAIFNTWTTHMSKSWNDRQHDLTWADTLCPQLVKVLQSITGTTSYVSLVSNATDRDSTSLVFTNLSSTISQIEYTVLFVIILMAILIILLISLLIINDSKKLAAIMKALGYSDRKNIASFLSIYIPVVLLSVAISIPIAIGLVAAFNGIIFSGVGIFLTTSVTVIDIIAALGVTLPFFAISAMIGFGSLRREKLTERLKA